MYTHYAAEERKVIPSDEKPLYCYVFNEHDVAGSTDAIEKDRSDCEELSACVRTL